MIEQTHPSSSLIPRKDLMPDLGDSFSPGILGFLTFQIRNPRVLAISTYKISAHLSRDPQPLGTARGAVLSLESTQFLAGGREGLAGGDTVSAHFQHGLQLHL